ncbi:sperm-associated antigen 8 [Lingula anatina]|uniref:Sperm-associated antigen 8 n=1 Tax=Lingula anatina TaxID=7574 RepID=A0A1S3K1N9_LINAN|nr:sperm-associated antigen 8 [Lingula anatina]|eukprot:XP_013416545.1 sperm-associated antigen 8 [Lingula anatina]
MSTLNQGRNEIRFNNSGGRCLLENWVEERNVAHLDPAGGGADVTSLAQVFKHGHNGVLSTEFDAKAENLTTVRESYRPPTKPGVRQVGKKHELLEQMFFEQVSKEVHEDFNPPPPQPDYLSVTTKDFSKEFESIKPAPTQPHDLTREQPVTFWTEHVDKLHGVSQIKTKDTPFRKNAAFSKPIDEYMDQPQPYELENYPKM